MSWLLLGTLLIWFLIGCHLLPRPKPDFLHCWETINVNAYGLVSDRQTM